MLAGKTIVFTGTLSTPRAQAKTLAEAAGAKVVGSVSGNTDFLVCGENAGKKSDDAKKKGVSILMEEDFLKHVSGKAVAKSPPKSKAKVQPEPAKAKAAGKTKRADADDEPAPKKAKAEPKGKKAAADANNALSAPIVQKNNSTGSISVDTHCGYRNAGGKVHADFGRFRTSTRQ